MAFETDSATDVNDLLNKLNTFAVANGWTSDYFNFSDPLVRLSLHQGDIYVNFLAATSDTKIMCSQALGFAGTGVAYYLQTDDSGGEFSASPGFSNSSKHIKLDNLGVYPQYWFFADNATEAYIHIVVQTGALRYRHFGFGELRKFGDWTGGEYLVHNAMNENTSMGGQNGEAFLWDGTQNSNQNRACTIHTEGLPGQLAAGKWSIMNRRDEISTTDRAGELRVNAIGDNRGGIMDPALGVVTTTQAGVFTPLRPVHVFALNGNVSPRQAFLMGHVPDTKNLNIGRFAPGVEVNLGGDTYIPFPYLSTGLTEFGNQLSGEGGIAYLKVT